MSPPFFFLTKTIKATGSFLWHGLSRHTCLQWQIGIAQDKHSLDLIFLPENSLTQGTRLDVTKGNFLPHC